MQCTIDLNEMVRFKPTDKGKQLLLKESTEYTMWVGFVTMPLWNFARVFGPYMPLTIKDPLIEGDLILE